MQRKCAIILKKKLVDANMGGVWVKNQLNIESKICSLLQDDDDEILEEI